MNKSQSNKLEMYAKTQAFLGSTTATSGLAALAPKVASLENKIKLIGELSNVQTLPTDGATSDRLATLEAAVRASFAVAGPVLSYARTSGLAQLESLVEVSRSDFKAIRQNERTRLAQRILDAATPLLVAAGPFGLTQELLDELADKITVANAAVNSPRAVVSDKRVATQSLALAFAEADVLLEQIDPMMEPFRVSQPEVFARYQIARQVIDRPGARSGDPVPASAKASAVATAPAAQAGAGQLTEHLALPKAA